MGQSKINHSYKSFFSLSLSQCKRVLWKTNADLLLVRTKNTSQWMLCLFSEAIETKPFSFTLNNFYIIFIVGMNTHTHRHTLLYGSSSWGFPFSKACIRRTTHLYKTDAYPKISHRILVYRDNTNMFQINYDLPFRILWWSASFDGDGVSRGRDVGVITWWGYELGWKYCIVEIKFIPNTQPDHMWILLELLFPRMMFCHATLFPLDIFIYIS